MKRLRALWIGTVIGVVGLGAHTWRQRIEPAANDRYVRDIRELQALDARLNGQVMQCRQALVAHYDDLVRTQRAIDGVHARLRASPSFVAAEERGDVDALVAASVETMAEKAAQVESFKSQNAVLRNSVRFFPVATEELRDRFDAHADGRALARSTNELLASVLRFMQLPGSTAARSRAQAAIDGLSSHELPAGAERDVSVVVMHARAVLERGVRVDELTNEILAVPTASRAALLDAAYQRAFQRAIRDTERRTSAIFALALAAVALVAADLIVRLRKGAASERAANELLARANHTLRREKERERELSDLKSRFVSMASHEFRTPLSVILSSTELLEAYGERWSPLKKSDHFQRIKKAIGGMTELLDGILVIGKSEMSKLDCNPAQLDLGRYARGLLDAIEPTLTKKHTFESLIADDLERAWADEKLLDHILTNLLSNAVKYSPEGGVVRFEVRRDGERALFEVSDHGIGIPEQDLARLFESFHRGTNVGHIPGTGLGLAVVKRSVEAHGGTLEVRSEPGVGTTFSVRIPLEGPFDSAPSVAGAGKVEDGAARTHAAGEANI